MSNILLIFVCLISGYLLKKYRVVNSTAFKTLNHVIIYFSLPALTLYFIPKIEIHFSLLYAVVAPWINFGLAFLFFAFLGNKLKWSHKLTGAIIMMTGFGNTSFMGFPIIQSLYGDDGIKTAMMVDLPGSFVAISTLGVAVSGYYASGETHLKNTLMNVLKFPPFVVFVVSFCINLSGFQLPLSVDETLQKIGYTVVPLALLSVGMQWELDMKSKHWGFVWLGLFFKLIMVPLVIFILYIFVFGQKGELIEISILESAMAPMVVASIVASSYGLKPKYCSMMLGVGIPLSFFTIALWYMVLTFVR